MAADGHLGMTALSRVTLASAMRYSQQAVQTPCLSVCLSHPEIVSNRTKLDHEVLLFTNE